MIGVSALEPDKEKGCRCFVPDTALGYLRSVFKQRHLQLRRISMEGDALARSIP